MKRDWHFIAPDWRGYGMSAWSGAQSYWQPDLTADLHALLEHFSPDEPARLMTHSLGGNVTGVYAGLKPERVRLFINVEGYNVPAIKPEDAPKKYGAWLDAVAREDVPVRSYPGYEAFAERMRKGNPRLNEERALFLARHWCKDAPGGGVTLRSDPAYARSHPVMYRLDEQSQYWSRVTAPTLWVEGGQSDWLHELIRTGEYEKRRACYRHLSVARFENAGHNVHHEEPERLAELCEAFLLEH
jgi:pimeloyl-ACP methyl ester carboxylesterase